MIYNNFKIKNFLQILIAMTFISLVIANYRYPFFYNKNLPWEVGYNISQKLDNQLSINQQNIISSIDIINTDHEIESKFIADPFFIIKDDTTFLFVENQINGDGAVIDLFKKFNNDVVYGGTILNPEFHISFPQVFKYEDEFYMLPETKRSNNVLLYKSNAFPYDWNVSDTLIKNVRYKDPAILIMDSLKIIFTCNDDLELFVYCSDNIFEGWKECDDYKKKYGNEVRAGGRIINYNERYYLPMQNMREAYGTSLTLYEISNSQKGIRLIKRIENLISPQKGELHFNSAMHHLDFQKYNDNYVYYYDGQNFDRKQFSFKRSIKLNLLDFKNIVIKLLS